MEIFEDARFSANFFAVISFDGPEKTVSMPSSKFTIYLILFTLWKKLDGWILISFSISEIIDRQKKKTEKQNKPTNNGL